MRIGVVLVLAANASLAASSVPTQRAVSCTLGLDAASSDLPIPTLTPPPGAEVPAGSRTTSSGRSGFRCGLRYGSTRSTPVLADHVTAQMTAAGWRQTGREQQASTAFSTYTGTSNAGAPLSAVTIVAALDGTPYHDVALRIFRQGAITLDPPRLPPLPGRAGGAGAAGKASLTEILISLVKTAAPATSGVPYKEGSALPPAFPIELLPKGMEVRMSAVNEPSSTIVGVAAGLTAFDLPAYFVGASSAGWLVRASPGGLSPDLDSVLQRSTEICRGSETATIDFVPLETGFAVRVRHSRGSVPCPSRPRPFADVAPPLLVPPGVTAASGTSGSISTDTRDFEMAVQTNVDASAVVKELATQLGRGDWTVVSQQAAGEATLIRGRSTTASGDPVSAMVTVVPSGAPSQFNLWLHLVKHKPGAR